MSDRRPRESEPIDEVAAVRSRVGTGEDTFTCLHGRLTLATRPLRTYQTRPFVPLSKCLSRIPALATRVGRIENVPQSFNVTAAPLWTTRTQKITEGGFRVAGCIDLSRSNVVELSIDLTQSLLIHHRSP